MNEINILIFYYGNSNQLNLKIEEILESNRLLKSLNINFREEYYVQDKVKFRKILNDSTADLLIFAHNLYSLKDFKSEIDNVLNKYGKNYFKTYIQQDMRWDVFKKDISNILLEIREEIYKENILSQEQEEIEEIDFEILSNNIEFNDEDIISITDDDQDYKKTENNSEEIEEHIEQDDNVVSDNNIQENQKEDNTSINEFKLDEDPNFFEFIKKEDEEKISFLLEDEKEDEEKISKQKKLFNINKPEEKIENKQYISEDEFNKMADYVLNSDEEQQEELPVIEDDFLDIFDDEELIDTEEDNDDDVEDEDEKNEKTNESVKANISLKLPKFPNFDIKFKKKVKKKDNIVEEIIPLGKDIGFIGNTFAVGTTFIAISIAEYYANKNATVNFIDITNKNYKRLNKFKEDKKIKFNIFCKEDMNLAYRDSNAIKIIDFGVLNLNSKENIVDFERCNYKFIVGIPSMLKIMDYNINVEYDNKEVYSIFNMTSEEEIESYNKIFKDLNVKNFPFISDPTEKINSNIFKVFNKE